MPSLNLILSKISTFTFLWVSLLSLGAILIYSYVFVDPYGMSCLKIRGLEITTLNYSNWGLFCNKSISGEPVTINGVTKKPFIAAHPLTTMKFKVLNKNCFLKLTVGIPDYMTSAGAGTVRMHLSTNGGQSKTSDIATKGHPETLYLSLRSATELTLSVNDAGDSDYGDHAVIYDISNVCE